MDMSQNFLWCAVADAPIHVSPVTEKSCEVPMTAKVALKPSYFPPLIALIIPWKTSCRWGSNFSYHDFAVPTATSSLPAAKPS